MLNDTRGHLWNAKNQIFELRLKGGIQTPGSSFYPGPAIQNEKKDNIGPGTIFTTDPHNFHPVPDFFA